MANRKKIFARISASTTNTKEKPSEVGIDRNALHIAVPRNSCRRRSIDYTKHLDLGCDEIVRAIADAISRAFDVGTDRPNTILKWATGSSSFIRFCIEKARNQEQELLLTDISDEFIRDFIVWLSEQPGLELGGQRNYYQDTRRVLTLIGEANKDFIPEHLLPRNVHTQRNRAKKENKYYSQREWGQILAAFRKELRIIFQNQHEEPTSETLSILVLALCIRTGRNVAPILDMTRNGLIPSPFYPDQMLLVTHKHRGNSTHVMPLRWSKDVTEVSPLLSDGVAVLKLAETLTEPLSAQAPDYLSQRLWIFRRRSYGKDRGEITILNALIILKYAKKIADTHDLRADDGSRLILNVRKIRRAWVNRLANLAAGDLFAVSKLAGHSIQVSGEHYLDTSDEMTINHKFVVEDLVSALSEKGAQENHSAMTRISRCRNPEGGSQNKDPGGNLCTNFSACFRCSSFVVTSDEEDVYRLYSYYWFCVREREVIGSTKWSRYYKYVVKVVDEKIAPQIGLSRAAKIKEKARVDPHPFWKSMSFYGNRYEDS